MDELGRLAFEFRGTRDLNLRNQIAEQYSEEINRLIQSGTWNELPVMEDLFPDAYLPNAFFEYWNLPFPKDKKRDR